MKNGIVSAITILLMAITGLFILLGDPASAQSPLVLSTVNAAPLSTPDKKGLGDRVVAEAFRRLGMTIQIKHLPMERALFDANEGVDDGNFVRIEGLTGQYPNLIMVPEDILQAEFVVFSKRKQLRISSWNDLKPYRVGIIRGCKIAEMNTGGVTALTKAKDLKQLIELLALDKIELAVYDRQHAQVMIDRTGVKSIGVVSDRPLARQSMYLYLQKKHQLLVPRVAKAIRDMKTDGAYAAINDEVMKTLSLQRTCPVP